MVTHSFKVGETLHFTPGRADYHAEAGAYKVVRQLPKEGQELLYRVQCVTDQRERVVRESQLTAR